jgi:hypothetical protein
LGTAWQGYFFVFFKMAGSGAAWSGTAMRGTVRQGQARQGILFIDFQAWPGLVRLGLAVSG